MTLAAVGPPPASTEQDLGAADLERYRAAVGRMLVAHAPFPGFVFGRGWNTVAATPADERLLAGSPERNVMRLTFDQRGTWRELLENWEHVAAYGRAQLQDDVLRFPHDAQLHDLGDLALATALDTE